MGGRTGLRVPRPFSGRERRLGPLTADPDLWSVDPATAPVDETLLDEGSRARAARRPAGSTRRRDYVAAHTALRVLLGAYLHRDPASVRTERADCPLCGGPHGRPRVAGDPLHFSLSHSHGAVLVAFARSPVGVDVEKVPALARADKVAELLTAAERAELASCAEPGRPVAFTRVWARKEAYLKGLGTGLGRPLSEDHLGAGAAPVSPEGWRVRDVAAPAGFAAAVAHRLH